MKNLSSVTDPKDVATKEYADTKLAQVKNMPTASAEYEDSIIQYIGTTTTDFVNGCLYRCVNESGIYKWKSIAIVELKFVPQLDTFPNAEETDAPESFQFIGDDMVHDKFVHYKKVTGNYTVTAPTFGTFYSTIEPPEGSYCTLYTDPDCAYESLQYDATNNGAQVIVRDKLTEDTDYASLAGGTRYEPITGEAGDAYTKSESDARFLKLSGGTMTGALCVKHGNGGSIVNSVDDSFIEIYGGTNYDKGAYLLLKGKDSSASGGSFVLGAITATGIRMTLSGYANGTLEWNGSQLLTQSQADARFLKLSGGAMTGDIVRGDNVTYNRIAGGVNSNNGAVLTVYGKDNTTAPACFSLAAKTSTGFNELLGKPDGSLLWMGNQVCTKKEATISFESIESGWTVTDASAVQIAPNVYYVMFSLTNTSAITTAYKKLCANTITINGVTPYKRQVLSGQAHSDGAVTTLVKNSSANWWVGAPTRTIAANEKIYFSGVLRTA